MKPYAATDPSSRRYAVALVASSIHIAMSCGRTNPSTVRLSSAHASSRSWVSAVARNSGGSAGRRVGSCSPLSVKFGVRGAMPKVVYSPVETGWIVSTIVASRTPARSAAGGRSASSRACPIPRVCARGATNRNDRNQ